MKAAPSTKVVHDAKGRPWLVVSRPPAGGYVAQRLEVVDEFEFARSWEAVDFARNWPASALVEVGE